MSIDRYALGRPCKQPETAPSAAEKAICPDTDPCLKCRETTVPIVTAAEAEIIRPK